jgi:hypothetical protein
MIERGKFTLGRESIDKRAHRGNLSLRQTHGRRIIFLVTAAMVHVGFVGDAEYLHSSLIAGI